jgi:hypothetical protein
MKRIRVQKPRVRRGRLGSEVLPVSPYDPEVRRAKALARAAGRGVAGT